MDSIEYHPIGIIRSPYRERAPSQGREDDVTGQFYLEVLPGLETALLDLEGFEYIIVLFHMDRIRGYDGSNIAHPPHMNGKSVGLFASRSPNRPNPIGLDVARIIRVDGARVYTSGLSALDGSPLLDIKPYIGLDSKLLHGSGNPAGTTRTKGGVDE
ncbi:MAG: tRNA (N6-threonylcarbamoyladenosine(37)-N6)-methyltransferase TrmO [Candidatus Fermentibacteraceae bacterium]|nr:tRNA (N6-threonylcarbamoyladenosine(37)-N6)-methyltransferase TrmO [Candidatus Fermentibacteraceae bacterium]MBN2608643.1 tRNA (N6-threonylcarbamoyladenosine(37)-N6)-methyltransferase TrmO [Candidatus Fermentibacteraceae bacterium]